MPILTSKELEIAKGNDIPESTVKTRVYVNGWEVHEAITRTPNRYKRRFTPEQLETAQKNGVPYKQIYQRVVIRGWDVETAIHTPIMDHDQRKNRIFNKRMV